MSLALLFPGQGTQQADSLRWIDELPEAAVAVDQLNMVLGADWRARMADASWATTNAIAQPLITGLSLAAWQCLRGRLPAPAVVAGYSVGELAAFSVAGLFDVKTALGLAQARADFMDGSVRGQETGLLAAQGRVAVAPSEWIARHGLALAIRLGPDAVIVGGPVLGLDAAERALSAVGAKVQRLAIRVASHTPWMAAASERFAQALGPLAFGAAQVPIVSNFTGHLARRNEALKDHLARQISSTVPWDRCLESVRERGVRCVLEVGPGSTLSNMWRARYPEVPARSLDEFRSVEAVASWVRSKTSAS